MSSRLYHPYVRVFWLLALLGGALRLLRLDWQPLWWDEGYSVYFATESIGEMIRLTAQDIHPPLYYTLLHLWLALFGSAAPLILRAFSVLVGILSLFAFYWLAHCFYPARPRLALTALLLLAVSPMHIFYSQEVRMYGLEMLLGMISTGFFWRLTQAEGSGKRGRVWAGYVTATIALLYTEYYAVLLLLGHSLWAAWHFRRQLRRMLPLLAAWLAACLAFLPWLFYAVPELIPYVSQKIVADADRPLGLISYTFRHLSAFTTGHVPSALPWTPALPWLVILLLLGLMAANLRRTAYPSIVANSQSPASYLWFLLLPPFTIGFLLNLRLPFFPEGGERVLLFVLPYFLLLIAAGLDTILQTAQHWMRGLATIVVMGLLLGAGIGVWNFYTVPRYTEDDYRPLIRQVVQQGSDTDTVLAVFPWQVGYWRAYAPVWGVGEPGRGELHGPWPLLTPSPAWGADVQKAIDDALARGKLWFPAHLSLGGILEGRIEEYLRTQVVSPSGQVTLNFENRWYSLTTRLSGWAQSATAQRTAVAADFSSVQLQWAGEESGGATSANDILTVVLGWGRVPAQSLRVTLRLEDEQGRVWAQRDYAPLGSWPPAAGVAGAASAVDQVGLLIPPAVPPGFYRLAVGVGPAEDDWLYPVAGAQGLSDVATVGNVRIDAPADALPALRLPRQVALDRPIRRESIDFLGASGFDPAVATLAGAEMNVSLFVQPWQTPPTAWDIYVSLLDGNGDGVAGWEGWPLPAYPIHLWPAGTQIRLPVHFYLPASLSPGEYHMVAGLRNPRSGEKSVPVRLGTLPIVRRPASFIPPQPQHPLDQPALFGSHASLLGYDSVATGDGMLDLTLYWRVEQTLLPPHVVFVHLRDGAGLFLAQDDGVPGRRQIAAPSNTWMPGEVIVDRHPLIDPGPAGGVAEVGLYDPISGVRLPVNVNGEIVGDSYPILLNAPHLNTP